MVEPVVRLEVRRVDSAGDLFSLTVHTTDPKPAVFAVDHEQLADLAAQLRFLGVE